MSDLTECPNCGREAEKAVSSNFFLSTHVLNAKKSIVMNAAMAAIARTVVQANMLIMIRCTHKNPNQTNITIIIK